VIVNEFDIVCIAALPPKTYTPLVIDANTVLTGAIGFQLLQAIAGRRPQIVERLGGVDHGELPQHDALQGARKTPYVLAKKEPFRVPVAKALDHPGS
jgi:hypothetical protein